MLSVCYLPLYVTLILAGHKLQRLHHFNEASHVITICRSLRSRLDLLAAVLYTDILILLFSRAYAIPLDSDEYPNKRLHVLQVRSSIILAQRFGHNRI